MKNLSLNLKILIIFFIPALALIYFSFSFVKIEYKNLNQSSMYILSAKITESLSQLVHNIQIERGLSSGYIVANGNSADKKHLLKQYQKTDEAYKNLLKYVNLKSKEKEMILEHIGYVNKPLIKEMLNRFSNINYIRKNVQNLSISFDDEVSYYTNLNVVLLDAIKSFVTILKKQNNDDNSLSKLQMLKEYAGQERAYIYYMILSGNKTEKQKRKVKELINQQIDLKKEFVLNASIASTIIYNNIMKKEIQHDVVLLQKKFFENKLDAKDASLWFRVITSKINMLEKVSSMILETYINKSNTIYQKSLNSLYFTALLWGLSLVSIVILTFILRNLIKKEEFLVEELRISSYTFDSHEAMTITDVNGVILKVNDAFSRITGYLPSEVVGKNPRVLKSMKHSDEFYKEMWRQLHTVGRWSDEIYNKRKNGDIYLEHLSITAIKNKKDITTHYIAQFLDVSELKQAQEEAQHQADHDSLTGLLNRKALLQRLGEEYVKARRHDFLHAFLFIDLDEFKSVNDNFGHKAGDMLLIEVSKRLRGMFREEDVISRMSGDEFAIMVLNIDKTDQEAAKNIKEIAAKVIDKLNQPFVLDEHKIHIGASVGVKLFPDSEKSMQDVVVHADTAMYQAKHQGKNQFVFFDKAIELELKYFHFLEEELSYAIEKDEFVFYFQPKVDLKTGKIVEAEALLRWNHPQKGLLMPDTFLNVLQTTGMIHSVTFKALKDSCLFLESNKDIFDGTISININSNELVNDDFENEVMSIIKQFDISPSQIELEITENDLIEDFDVAILKMKKLKEFGVKFSIDDFGTGYSSITYLQKLPIDSLKIDRSFLRDLSNEANQEIVKIILAMAKTFNLCSVVEGVENQNHLNFIKENGADLYQGFYFSKAVSEKDFIKML